MDKCIWVGAGYPVFILAVAALWKMLLKYIKKVQTIQEDLLREKEWHVRELEEFKRMVERRQKQ